MRRLGYIDPADWTHDYQAPSKERPSTKTAWVLYTSVIHLTYPTTKQVGTVACSITLVKVATLGIRKWEGNKAYG